MSEQDGMTGARLEQPGEPEHQGFATAETPAHGGQVVAGTEELIERAIDSVLEQVPETHDEEPEGAAKLQPWAETAAPPSKNKRPLAELLEQYAARVQADPDAVAGRPRGQHPAVAFFARFTPLGRRGDGDGGGGGGGRKRRGRRGRGAAGEGAPQRQQPAQAVASAPPAQPGQAGSGRGRRRRGGAGGGRPAGQQQAPAGQAGTRPQQPPRPAAGGDAQQQQGGGRRSSRGRGRRRRGGGGGGGGAGAGGAPGGATG
jgi:hypothetical protein